MLQLCVTVVVIVFSLTPGLDAVAYCKRTKCKLPNCYCPGESHKIPTGWSPSEVPQMVAFTFTDWINKQNWDLFDEVFPLDRKNPNGCPYTYTLFTSHNYTDYCMIKHHWARGHEIALFSINRGLDEKVPSEYWRTNASYADWIRETSGFRKNVSKLAEIPEEDIKGWRTPFLLTGGNKQFYTLYKQGFLYDSTLITGNAKPEFPMNWPYTLDYGQSPLQCFNYPCLTWNNFTGIWEMPIQRMADLAGVDCNAMHSCINGPDGENIAEDQRANLTYELFWKNFQKAYRGNRAPLIFNMNIGWLGRTNYSKPGFLRFLDKLGTMDDVYVITLTQIINWLRKPVPLKFVHFFEGWDCESRKVKCKFKHELDEEALTKANPFAGLNRIWWIQTLLLGVIFAILYRKDHQDD